MGQSDTDAESLTETGSCIDSLVPLATLWIETALDDCTARVLAAEDLSAPENAPSILSQGFKAIGAKQIESVLAMCKG